MKKTCDITDPDYENHLEFFHAIVYKRLPISLLLPAQTDVGNGTKADRGENFKRDGRHGGEIDPAVPKNRAESTRGPDVSCVRVVRLGKFELHPENQ